MNSQREAAEALAEIGPEARPAVPRLMARLRENSGYHAWFCKALGRIGPDARDAVPLLENFLTNDNAGIRLAAAEALTRIVPSQCSNAVAVLKSLQHDPQVATFWRTDGSKYLDFDNPQSRFLRLAAAVPLWKLGVEKQSPLPALMDELSKGESSDQSRLIELFGDLGPEASAALPKLTKFLDSDKWIRIRRTTANTIRKISPEEGVRLNLPGVLALP